jgi:hypothetical protein
MKTMIVHQKRRQKDDAREAAVEEKSIGKENRNMH